MINRKGKALLRRKCRPCSPIEKWLVKTHEKMCSMLQHPTSLWLPAVHLLASTDLRHFSDFGALGLGGQRWLGLVVAGSLQGSACAAKISSNKKTRHQSRRVVSDTRAILGRGHGPLNCFLKGWLAGLAFKVKYGHLPAPEGSRGPSNWLCFRFT